MSASPPDGSGDWLPLYKFGHAEPIGWVSKSTGRWSDDDDVKRRLARGEELTFAVPRGREDRVRFLEKFTGLKVEVV